MPSITREKPFRLQMTGTDMQKQSNGCGSSPTLSILTGLNPVTYSIYLPTLLSLLVFSTPIFSILLPMNHMLPCGLERQDKRAPPWLVESALEDRITALQLLKHKHGTPSLPV